MPNNIGILQPDKKVDGNSLMFMASPDMQILDKNGEFDQSKLIHIVPYAKVDSPRKGKFEIGDKQMAQIMQNFENDANDLVFDYGHASIFNAEAPAAGWIKEIVKKKLGLFARVEWTPKALEHLKSKEYKYTSPSIMFSALDRKNGMPIGAALHSQALTNVPYLDGMEPIVNKDTDVNNNNNNHKELDMALLKTLADKLGMPAETTEEQLIERVEKLKETPDEVKTLTDTVGAKDAEIVALKAEVAEFKKNGIDGDAKFKTLSDELQEVKKERAEEKSIALFDAAFKAGKILPVQSEKAKAFAIKDPVQFAETYGENAPVVAPLGSMTDPAKFGDDGYVGGDLEAQMLKDIDAKMKENTELSYKDAVLLVAEENPTYEKL